MVIVVVMIVVLVVLLSLAPASLADRVGWLGEKVEVRESVGSGDGV